VESRIPFELPAWDPVALAMSPAARSQAFPNARLRRMEFSCRGDRVPCTLLSPEAAGSSEGGQPLVLLQPASRDWNAAQLPERTRHWLDAGCAVASIELPLQGTRRSAKQSQLLADSIRAAARGEELPHASVLLWCEFTRQAVLELRRALDVLMQLPDIDARRIGFAGFGIGGFTGAILCAVDSRPRAVVVAAVGGGFAPPQIDPARYIGDIAPRPLLLVNDEGADPSGGGPAVPREAAEQLHRAANDPKRIEWRSDAAHAHDAAWLFLSPLLCPSP